MRALQLCQQFIYKKTTTGEYVQGKQTGSGGEGEGGGGLHGDLKTLV